MFFSKITKNKIISAQSEYKQVEEYNIKKSICKHENINKLGTTRQLTDDYSDVMVAYTYNGFGNLIDSIGTSENTCGFTGEQQFYKADNLVFLRARYYDAKAGRFISRDSLGISEPAKTIFFNPMLRSIVGTNLYLYVKNNSVNLKDRKDYIHGMVIIVVQAAAAGDPIDIDSACRDNDNCYGYCGGP